VKPATSLIDSQWLAPPQTLSLDNNGVHVWRADLDQEPSIVGQFQHTLSVDERLRAHRFYFHQDRKRFIVGRGLLRTILGRYLDRAPEKLAFKYNHCGKPSIVSKAGAEPIRFNVSHSHGTALYAITRDLEIGVDLELIRDGLEVEQIATSFFSRREVSALNALPAELRRRAFFLCWTRKEAYVKARGEGLSLPLDQFEVSLSPGEPAALLSTQPDSGETFRWTLQDLSLASGYVAAFAVRGRASSLCCWQSLDALD
jgi:4'-phosphopantetheinyl transferase